MSMSVRSTLAAAFVASAMLAAPVMADTVYECQIQQIAKNGGWLPEVVAVAIKADGSAVVNDPLINHFVGKPLEAKIDTDNTKRTTLSWKLQTKSRTNQTATQSYRLTIIKGDLTASMTSSVGRYSNQYSARGKCKQMKG